MKKYWLLAKLLIAVLVLTFLIHTLRKDQVDFREVLRLANTTYLALVVLLLIPNLLLQFWKWHYLLRLSKPGATWREVVRSVLGGSTLGFITPGRVGEWARALFIRGDHRIRITALAIIDKFFNLLVTMITGAVGILLIFKYAINLPIYALVPVMVLSSLGLLILVYLAVHPDFIKGIFTTVFPFLPKREEWRELLEAMDVFHYRQAWITFSFSIGLFIVYSIQFYFAILAFEPVNFFDSLAGSSAALFAKTWLPISFGELGIREGAMMYFYGKVGVASSSAFLTSILVWITNVMAPAVLGLYAVIGMSLNGNRKP